MNGLLVYHGAQVAIDATIVSPIRADGRPRPQAARQAGVALQAARLRKRATYPEFHSSRGYRLLVAAVETGGRWDEESYKFLVQLAKAKARSAPSVLRSSLTNAWLRRWSGMLAFAAHDALAASLLEDVPAETVATDGPEPAAGVLLADSPVA